MSIHTRLVPGQHRRENRHGCCNAIMMTLTVIGAALVGIAIMLIAESITAIINRLTGV